MRNLKQDTDTVTGFARSILTGSVLELFNDFQRIINHLMAFRSVNAYHSTDAARIMLKGTVIKTFLYSFHIVTSDSKPDCLLYKNKKGRISPERKHPCLSI